MSRTPVRRRHLALVAAPLLLLAACGDDSSASDTTTAPAATTAASTATTAKAAAAATTTAAAAPTTAAKTYEPVTIKFSDPGNQGVLAYAKKNGSLDAPLAAVNAKIEWVPAAGAFSANFDAMKAGNINASGAAVSPVLGALTRGLDFQIFAFTDPSQDKTQGIVATKDSGIKTVADLVGKKVAVNAKAHGEWILLQALAEAGVDPTKVERVPIQPPDAAAAFASGQIQAWATFGDFFSGAVAKGATVVAYESDFKNNDDVTVVGASKAVITKNPKAFEVFTKVYADLVNQSHSAPEKFVNVFDTSGPKALSGDVLAAQTEAIRTGAVPRVATAADIERANRVVKLFVDNGVLDKTFDVGSVVFDITKALGS